MLGFKVSWVLYVVCGRGRDEGSTGNKLVRKWRGDSLARALSSSPPTHLSLSHNPPLSRLTQTHKHAYRWRCVVVHQASVMV